MAVDTVVALSTGSLPSGVAIVRASGPRVRDLLAVSIGNVPAPRRLVLSFIRDGEDLLDNGLVAFFPAPNSFTGEDCAEWHVHGSRAVVAALLRSLTRPDGVRLADAGEFTRRAFENGKLDLTEVEGLGDLLEAETETQRRQAVLRMNGGLSDKLAGWRNVILNLRAEIEAQLDFSDEGDVGDLPQDFADRLATLRDEIQALSAQTDSGRIMREGARIALAGLPNAGKSSLLNALAREEIAIVTDEPGTTRDVREVALDLNGQRVTLVDMAGLRETASKAEAEGVRRAQREIEAAHLVLWLEAPDAPETAPPPTSAPVWRLGTKSDLGKVDRADLSLSVQTGQGVGALLARLSDFVAGLTGSEPILVSRARDEAALNDAAKALQQSLNEWNRPELVAEDLRSASVALERLLGRIDSEAVLDRLFSAFCIGK